MVIICNAKNGYQDISSHLTLITILGNLKSYINKNSG